MKSRLNLLMKCWVVCKLSDNINLKINKMKNKEGYVKFNINHHVLVKLKDMLSSFSR